MTHVMVDLETLGVRPGCTVLSIGAVAFGPEGVAEDVKFHRVVSRASCRLAGFHEDPATLLWWGVQSEEARAVLRVADDPPPRSDVGSILHDFSGWLFGLGDLHGVWSLGADFDLPILAEAYRRCGFGAPPWPYNRGRCLRTLGALAPSVPRVKPVLAHDALADAAAQAAYASVCLRTLDPGAPGS